MENKIVYIKSLDLENFLDKELKLQWIETYTEKHNYSGYHYDIVLDLNGKLEIVGLLSKGEFLADYGKTLFYISELPASNELELEIITWEDVFALDNQMLFVDVVNKELSMAFNGVLEIKEYYKANVGAFCLDTIFEKNFNDIYKELLDIELENCWWDYRNEFEKELIKAINNDSGIGLI